MSLTKKSLIGFVLVGVLVMSSCANDKEQQQESTPVEQNETNEEAVAEENAIVESVETQEQVDEDGNLVDGEGNVIVSAEEAEAYEGLQGAEPISESDRAFVNRINKLNNSYIATLKLGIEKGSRQEIGDIANGLIGEHERLTDMLRIFLGETPEHIKKMLGKPANITGEKGKVWDDAWASELKKMNKELVKAIRNGKGNVEHEQLKLITMDFPEHLEHEQEMLGELKNMFNE